MRTFANILLCLLLSLLVPAMAQNSGLDTGARGEFNSDLYILKPGDKLDIFVNALPELETNYDIRVDGGLFHPLVGQMQASGLTVADLRAEFGRRLARELRRPYFRLGLKTISKHQVAVLGEAKSQGTYEVGVGSTVLDLLAKAGGLAETADKESATILRGTEQIDIRLEAVEGQGLTKLRPGDVLYIKAGTQVSVAGEVAEPGAYSVSGLTGGPWQAIIEAGGVKPEAALTRVKIFRPTESEPIVVNLRPEAAAELPDRVKVLKPGDVVMVPARQAVVLGSVADPGPVPLPNSKMTLLDVLAEKVNNQSDVKKVYVVRSDDVFKNRDKREEYNLEKFFREGEAGMAAVPINDGDLIFVPSKERSRGQGIFGSFQSIWSVINIARFLF